nr:MAG TPA_asm: hypothetical protein [Caudoviricetes sp.]DAZ20378.1 MAG TPA: hypothetical protein [Caudoviricetes sp.]
MILANVGTTFLKEYDTIVLQGMVNLVGLAD